MAPKAEQAVLNLDSIQGIASQRITFCGFTREALLADQRSYNTVLAKRVQGSGNSDFLHQWDGLPKTAQDEQNLSQYQVNTRGSFAAEDGSIAAQLKSFLQNGLTALKRFATRGAIDETQKKQLWTIITMCEQNRWAVGENLKKWVSIAGNLLNLADTFVKSNPLLAAGFGPMGGGFVATPASLIAVRNEIRSWLGVDYVYGGESRRGVDCSHWVRAVLNEIFPQAKIDYKGASVLCNYNPHGLTEIDSSQMGEHKFGIWAWPKPRGKDNGHCGFFVQAPDGSIEIYDASSSKDEVVCRPANQMLSYLKRQGARFFSLTAPDQKLMVRLNGPQGEYI